jgi:hypothetical protein
VRSGFFNFSLKFFNKDMKLENFEVLFDDETGEALPANF